ncbi:hypothetical protein H5410_050934 [Solanum commersonii]|uniref:Uncharacterized protein n=1 Tax=Solanum commersonii TaxID=4109 RepID=A0A9J5WWY2_SOLCO|nr:hypothetical protein H5410_050934 [Solanum commersonii]
MAIISPPKTTLNYIQRITSNFFWGGIGVRKLEDICTAMQFKQWWTFRTKKFLWSQFLRAKYCQRANLIAKKWDTG